MELEEGMVRKIGVSVGAVALFVAFVLVVGVRFGDGGFGARGGLVMIGAIVGFVLLMGGVGLLLED